MQTDSLYLTFSQSSDFIAIIFSAKNHFNFTPQMYKKVLYSQYLY